MFNMFGNRIVGRIGGEVSQTWSELVKVCACTFCIQVQKCISQMCVQYKQSETEQLSIDDRAATKPQSTTSHHSKAWDAVEKEPNL